MRGVAERFPPKSESAARRNPDRHPAPPVASSSATIPSRTRPAPAQTRHDQILMMDGAHRKEKDAQRSRADKHRRPEEARRTAAAVTGLTSSHP
ncbi:hypothetical protein GCM10027168_12330 [Streptomyces capparidis]